MNGYLELIVGPMFSGKTSRLIDKYNEYSNHQRVLVINHILDTRYSSDNIMVSHDGKNIQCVRLSKLSELDQLNYDMFLINEANLFPDLVEFILLHMNHKQIYVAGLDGDYKRCHFGDLHLLYPYADNIIKLKGICELCKVNPSIYTIRTTNDTSQILIGVDQYKPVCRSCYQ